MLLADTFHSSCSTCGYTLLADTLFVHSRSLCQNSSWQDFSWSLLSCHVLIFEFLSSFLNGQNLLNGHTLLSLANILSYWSTSFLSGIKCSIIVLSSITLQDHSAVPATPCRKLVLCTSWVWPRLWQKHKYQSVHPLLPLLLLLLFFFLLFLTFLWTTGTNNYTQTCTTWCW